MLSPLVKERCGLECVSVSNPCHHWMYSVCEYTDVCVCVNVGW